MLPSCRRAPAASAPSRFTRRPVEMSSSTVTSSPRASSASTRLEPMNPAPPVTSARTPLVRVIPEPEYAALALEAEVADRGGAESEPAARLRRELDPAGADHAQEVPMREQRDVAARGERTLDHPVGAGAGVLERLAARRPVAPDVPAGPLLPDLERGPPLVLAVAELAQVLQDLGALSEARQLAGVPRALHRAGGHVLEVVPRETLAQPRRVAHADAGQGQVGAAGVLAGFAPFGLAVTDQEDRGPGSGCHHAIMPITAPR